MINYYLLTKPGILIGNLFTLAAGFLLASRGTINFGLFFATLLGLGLIMASGCVFNNYIDRQIDKKMERTKRRALVLGLISGRNALLYASVLGILGSAILFAYTNVLTVFMAGVGFFVYVILYSMWKGKTIYGTAIGSIAGAVPPVVGYCAVSNRFDSGAMIFFLIMVFWQMPHFFSVAMSHIDDYLKASIPVLPVIKGPYRTKVHMVIYIMAFMMAASALVFFNFAGYLYLSAVLMLGFIWLLFCLFGFKDQDDQLWAQRMFQISLVNIIGLCIMLPFDL